MTVPKDMNYLKKAGKDSSVYEEISPLPNN